MQINAIIMKAAVAESQKNTYLLSRSEFIPMKIGNLASQERVFGTLWQIYPVKIAGRVAELADAQGLGPCVRKDVGVQLLSRPQFCTGRARFRTLCPQGRRG